MKRERLSPQSWIEAGLSELAAQGPNALAAEPLARKLETTKGSFYWHFKDVPDFQAAVIKHWQSAAFSDVLQSLEENGNAEQRLRRFGKKVLSNSQDPAMRAWARADKKVAKAIAQVDAERMKYLTNLLRHLGIANDDFARGSLAALVGLPTIGNKTQASKAFETMIDLILALK
ncbi:MAG: TetR/AcrR family transcriptional regulator [Roseobacter sp.]